MSQSIPQALQLFKDGNTKWVKWICSKFAFFLGFRELGFPKLEPFYVEKLELSADSEKSVRLNQKYEHVYLYGITNTKINKFKLIDERYFSLFFLNFFLFVRMTDDGTNCLWEMELFSPSTRMEADYELTGQVLVFPINGHGKCNVTISELLLLTLCSHHQFNTNYRRYHRPTYSKMRALHEKRQIPLEIIRLQVKYESAELLL